jgi:hypothetical protein
MLGQNVIKYSRSPGKRRKGNANNTQDIDHLRHRGVGSMTAMKSAEQRTRENKSGFEKSLSDVTRFDFGTNYMICC